MKYIINQFDHFKTTKKIDFKLNKETFDVFVPSRALLSKNDKRFITMVNGEILESNYESYTKIIINVEQMLELYLDGYRIRLAFEDDAKRIYDNIQDYLNKVAELYSNNIEHMYNFDSRLRYLDKFADSIYETNKTLILSSPKRNDIDDFVKIAHYKKERIKSIAEERLEEQMNKAEMESNTFTPYIAQNFNNSNNYNSDFRKAKDIFDGIEQPIMDFSKGRESSYLNIERIKLERNQRRAPSEMSLIKDEQWN